MKNKTRTKVSEIGKAIRGAALLIEQNRHDPQTIAALREQANQADEIADKIFEEGIEEGISRSRGISLLDAYAIAIIPPLIQRASATIAGFNPEELIEIAFDLAEEAVRQSDKKKRRLNGNLFKNL